MTARQHDALQHDQLGLAATGLGDVDLDGVPDYAFGGPMAERDGRLRAGIARVFSGATGRLLYELRGTGESEVFGTSLGQIRDLDGDGADDLLVGAPNQRSAGAVHVISGRTGSRIRLLENTRPIGDFGWTATALGDLDGDGHEEIAVGDPLMDLGDDFLPGGVEIFSGATGRLIQRLEGDQDRARFGTRVDRVGDVDGDGRDDLAVSSPRASVAERSGAGLVRVYSSATWEPIYEISISEPGDQFGNDLASVADVDRDGIRELIVGAPGARNLRGRVFLLSGADGTPLWELGPLPGISLLGSTVGEAGDADGDGIADVLVASRENGEQDPGQVLLLSGLDGTEIVRLSAVEFGRDIGSSLAPWHDLDGDGRSEFLVGARRAENDEGRPSGIGYVLGLEALVRVAVDLEPRTCPTEFRLRERGVLQVAVFGNEEMDAGSIDPETVRLAGVPALRALPAVRDLGSSLDGDPCSCGNASRDGRVDRLFHFDAGAVARSISEGGEGERTLALTGSLEDGTVLSGAGCVIVGAGTRGLGAAQTSLLSNRGPNPIGRGVAASVELRVPAGGAEIDVAVYDVSGRRRAELVRGRLEGGVRTLAWDGRDDRGTAVTPGVYFVRARIGDRSEAMQVLYLR